MRTIVTIFLLCCCASRLASDDITKLVAIGRHVVDFSGHETPTKIRDGYLIGILVFNDGPESIVLPSSGLTFDVIQLDQRVEVQIGYHPAEFVSKSGRRTFIPSRESFMPVTLRKGECMSIGTLPFSIERELIGSRPLFFKFRTVGFLADRLGFSKVDLTCSMILPNFDQSPERRDP